MRNIVITGASRGIGFETAKAFCKNGDKVLISSRSEEKLQEAKELILSNYPTAQIETFAADASKQTDVEQLAAYIKTDFGGCDILVNNAGVFIPGSVHDEPIENFELMISTNLNSAYYLTKQITPLMLKQQQGDIVNICSIASNTSYANGGSYSISKFALLGFSKNLREELKPHGIRVMSVLPGATFTDSWAGADIDENRLMPAEDIASTIVHNCNLSRRTVVEEIILRPQLGDL